MYLTNNLQSPLAGNITFTICFDTVGGVGEFNFSRWQQVWLLTAEVKGLRTVRSALRELCRRKLE